MMGRREPAKCISRFRLRLEREDAPWNLGRRIYSRPGDAAPCLYMLVEGEPFEVAGTLLLDPQNRITGYTIVYQGTLTELPVEPRGIFLPALMANASSILLFHNHPSGDTTPSHKDILKTRELLEAGRMLGVELWDHLILGDPPFYQSVFEVMKRGRQPQPFRLPKMRPSRKAKPKYRHPETGQTWAGRGKMARWLREAIEAGTELEEFRVRE